MTVREMETGKSETLGGQTHFAVGSASTCIDRPRARDLLSGMLENLGPLRKVLLLPPDHTRFHSWSGPVTEILFDLLRDRADVMVLPALGTHVPMTAKQKQDMYPAIPLERFLDHRWREDLIRLGTIDEDFVDHVSQGMVRYPVPIEVNRILVEGEWDRIFSIGQLVPHEVIGIANHVKNVLIGVGGKETIHKSHYLGAVYGMERIMGEIQTPVRAVLQEGMNRFGGGLPITYVLTVRGDDAGTLVTRGLYAGEGSDCYEQGAALSREVNITALERAPKKVVVWLEPDEYHSTWLGNKAIYRTRRAIADDGELVVLAPGVKTFGEDAEIDRLIRAYGYRGTPGTVEAVAKNSELAANLAAAAHLIHGSSEGRFRITYAPGELSRSEIEEVGFGYLHPGEALSRYAPDRLSDGWNRVNGEEIFFVRHPGQGLWISEAT